MPGTPVSFRAQIEPRYQKGTAMSLRRGRFTTTATGLLAAVALGWVGAVVPLAAAPPPAQASTVDGPITRQEILNRAQYWVDQGITYTQTGPWFRDPEGDKTYRRDCSGLVSMAWHLSTSYVTSDFQGGNPMWSAFPQGWHDFQAGDAMVRTGHMELFSHWVDPSDHAKGAYVYSFNQDGETVQNPWAVSNFGNLGRNSWADLTSYVPIRRTNVVQSHPGGRQAAPDILLANGTIAAFDIRSGNVWGTNQVAAGGAFNPWQQLPGGPGFVGRPQALQVGNGIIAVFARTAAGAVYGTNQSAPGGAYQPWAVVGGAVSLASDPTVLLLANGAMTMYATGTDGNVWGSSQNGAGGPWSPWQQV
jgi:hypothetical protein